MGSQFAIQDFKFDKDKLLTNYWLNCNEGLEELFSDELKKNITEQDYNIDLKKVLQRIKNRRSMMVKL